VGFDILTLVDKESLEEYVNEQNLVTGFDTENTTFWNDSSLFWVPISDLAFYIETDFMPLAVWVESDKLALSVRIRSWPREHPDLDSGTWLEMAFNYVDGQFRLSHMLGDA
jgi:hypothetical protein